MMVAEDTCACRYKYVADSSPVRAVVRPHTTSVDEAHNVGCLDVVEVCSGGIVMSIG